MCLHIVAPLQCCRPHQIQLFILWKLLPVIDFGMMTSSSDLAASISLIHCNASMRFFAFDQTSVGKFTIQLRSSVWLGNFPKYISATLSSSPNTRGIVCHRREIASPDHMCLLSPENKVGVWIVMVLHFHVSQFLLSSNFPMIFPNSLNCYVSRQGHIWQVANQKRLQKYSYQLV